MEIWNADIKLGGFQTFSDFPILILVFSILKLRLWIYYKPFQGAHPSQFFYNDFYCNDLA